MMKKATAVLDFGTSKVLVLLAEESAYQKVTITSAGMAQYDGFMNGEWNAPSEVSDAIASAIEAAEKKVGTHIKEVYVGVPGEFVRVYVIESSVALQGADPKVTSADVEKLQRQATEMLDRPTGVIIHRSPAWFKVDGGQKTLEPVDQKGSTLEGMIGFVLADQFFINDVTERLKELGVEVRSVHRESNPARAVRAAEAVVVGGGNTFALIRAMQQQGLVQAIRERAFDGMPYIGWSAGSNVACPTICTTNDMPIVEPASFIAAGLVKFQINPHYTDAHPDGHAGETREQRILDYIAANPETYVAGLREGCMLRVEGDRLSLIGNRPMRIFRCGTQPFEVHPDEDLSFLM